jgi:TolB-like protein/AraC-like DNA-binding protein
MGIPFIFSNFELSRIVMSDPSQSRDHFIVQAEALIVENLSNEQFGVSELAAAMNMSRSNLLRKIKKRTGLSASQFIRQLRLQQGMDLLQSTSMTVSEISYQVGFGSTSYFIKCFREHYGYPPGEAAEKTQFEEEHSPAKDKNPNLRKRYLVISLMIVLLVILSIALYDRKEPGPEYELEKSIVVLPFKNESSDSTNVYFINGLMESTLNSLQKIEDFRVVSRTSAETYSNSDMSIPEIAEELNVNYVVEGSGQRVGDQVLLNIQLIEAVTDRPIWSEQYRREVIDVFDLQNEVARQIVSAVQATVTPAELEQIEKRPTENLVAYDYYLQALGPFHVRSREGLEEAIPLFEKAIEEDPEFSLAYAHVAISYFFLDVYQKQKQYTEQINTYADKALLFDSKSAESLIAKALYYMQTEEYRLAVPHLEKALEYNPNSSAVVQMLADLYARVIPDTGKYLEYAFKGIELDIAANDSVGKSYIYLTLSNALIQTGFEEEALTYINKSLDYNPENYYSPLVKCYVLYAMNRNLEQLQNQLLFEWKKDTTRLDILQEVAKAYYFQKKNDSAFYYFEKFAVSREKFGMDFYPQEDIKIAYTYKQQGLDEQAEQFYNSYSAYCEAERSIYKSASTAVKFAYEGSYDEAIEQLKIFSTQNSYQYWILLFIELDPIMEPLKSHPEFAPTIQKIKDRFWEEHEKLKASLEEKRFL